MASLHSIKRKKALKMENRIRVALYYAVQLLLDVLILYVFIRAFSLSFAFARDVFHDSAKDLKNTEFVNVYIASDSSTSDISETLYEAGVIKSKYVMMAKIKLNEVGGAIKTGKYKLSPSMTYAEIIKVITAGAYSNDLDDDYELITDEEKKATATDAIDASEIHDNSDVGSGDGGYEGDEYVPEDGGDTGEDGGE